MAYNPIKYRYITNQLYYEKWWFSSPLFQFTGEVHVVGARLRQRRRCGQPAGAQRHVNGG